MRLKKGDVVRYRGKAWVVLEASGYRVWLGTGIRYRYRENYLYEKMTSVPVKDVEVIGLTDRWWNRTVPWWWWWWLIKLSLVWENLTADLRPRRGRECASS